MNRLKLLKSIELSDGSLLLFVWILLPLFLVLLVHLLQTHLDRQSLQFLLVWLVHHVLLLLLLLFLVPLSSRLWLLLTLHQTQPDSFSQFWVHLLDSTHPTCVSSCLATVENFRSEQLIAQVNFSRLDKHRSTILLVFNRFYECFYLVSLLLSHISETYQVHCDIVLFKFFTQNLQCLPVFLNRRTNETNHPLFLRIVRSVFESESPNL